MLGTPGVGQGGASGTASHLISLQCGCVTGMAGDEPGGGSRDRQEELVHQAEQLRLHSEGNGEPTILNRGMTFLE